MRSKLLLAAALLGALSASAHADAINNLGLIQIPDPDVVPQSQSAPCVICATNQAHNPVGFGYNDFDSTGNTSSFNLFSSNITGSFGNGDNVTVTPYTGGQLRTFLQNLDPLHVNIEFAIAVDINTTKAKSEFLEFFQLINLGLPGSGDEEVIFDLRNIALPGIHNGNGAADYLITGFDLSGVGINDRLLFRASWSGAVDGGESFYLVPRLAFEVPGPIVGAGLPGLVAACFSLWGLAWHRRKRRMA